MTDNNDGVYLQNMSARHGRIFHRVPKLLVQTKACAEKMCDNASYSMRALILFHQKTASRFSRALDSEIRPKSSIAGAVRPASVGDAVRCCPNIARIAHPECVQVRRSLFAQVHGNFESHGNSAVCKVQVPNVILSYCHSIDIRHRGRRSGWSEGSVSLSQNCPPCLQIYSYVLSISLPAKLASENRSRGLASPALARFADCDLPSRQFRDGQ
jgi:hypothetical protein